MDTHTYSSSMEETRVSSEHFKRTIDNAGFSEPALKRPLDILISSTMLLFSAPVSLLIAAAIKLEDGGPIFYRQRRWGRFGKPFTVLKFRTMIPDADKKFGLLHAKVNDQRITRVGKILRGAGLDE